MQSNIFELIDLLVKMSGSKSNLDELKADLDDTESRILKVQKKLDNLDEEMSDDKYFDAQSEIVDRNIRISLVKKIQKLNKVKNDISKDLDAAKSDEITFHKELDDLIDKINEANKYNDVINDTKSNSDSFNQMIESENKRISHLVEKKKDLEERYSDVQKKVEYLADSLNEVVDKINKENDRLKEVEDNLSNIKSYIDLETKEKDENKYLDAKNQLDDLMHHKNEIINDAVYIAGSIKEHIANEEKDKIEEEFNHLVDIVSSIPFMNLEQDEIKNEKDKLSEELKNYDTEISQKEYQTMDKEFIEERIVYLKDNIDKINSEIASLNDKVSAINEASDLLSSKIYKAEDQISKIDKSLVDYESYDYEEETEIPKSVVQAANNKLKEEKDNISNIADKYREDVINKLEELNIVNSRLEKLNKEVQDKEKELDDLEKKAALSTKSSNILEEEKDKIKLEKINKLILNLNDREEFSKSISTIVDEFNMLLSSLEFVDKKTRSKLLYEDFGKESKKEDLTETKVENKESSNEVIETPSEEVEETEIIDEEKEEPIVEEKKVDVFDNSALKVDEEKPLEPTFEPVINDNENPFSFEQFVEEKPEENDSKLRVVELTEIPSNLKENNDQNFMVNDFQDDEYIDLDTAISSMEEN
ncbi:MAG: hypothetical protein J5634_02270 [Bacilli bacterium]|nr:hypothetical protein [Bacilli bacterium]